MSIKHIGIKFSDSQQLEISKNILEISKTNLEVSKKIMEQNSKIISLLEQYLQLQKDSFGQETIIYR